MKIAYYKRLPKKLSAISFQNNAAKSESKAGDALPLVPLSPSGRPQGNRREEKQSHRSMRSALKATRIGGQTTANNTRIKCSTEKISLPRASAQEPVGIYSFCIPLPPRYRARWTLPLHRNGGRPFEPTRARVVAPPRFPAGCGAAGTPTPQRCDSHLNSSSMLLSGASPTQARKMFSSMARCLLRALMHGVPLGTRGALVK